MEIATAAQEPQETPTRSSQPKGLASFSSGTERPTGAFWKTTLALCRASCQKNLDDAQYSQSQIKLDRYDQLFKELEFLASRPYARDLKAMRSDELHDDMVLMKLRDDNSAQFNGAMGHLMDRFLGNKDGFIELLSAIHGREVAKELDSLGMQTSANYDIRAYVRLNLKTKLPELPAGLRNWAQPAIIESVLKDIPKTLAQDILTGPGLGKEPNAEGVSTSIENISKILLRHAAVISILFEEQESFRHILADFSAAHDPIRFGAKEAVPKAHPLSQLETAKARPIDGTAWKVAPVETAKAV